MRRGTFFCIAIAATMLWSCTKHPEHIVNKADTTESNVMLPEPQQATEAVAKTPSTPEEEGQQLIENMDCLTCHKTDAKLIGPSYQEVAAKYTDADIDMLAQKIIDGGAGNWGDIAMTPHPSLQIDKAKAMVKYILSLK